MVVKVLILVQDRIFTDALATWLDAESDMRVVAALHDRVPPPLVLAASTSSGARNAPRALVDQWPQIRGVRRVASGCPGGMNVSDIGKGDGACLRHSRPLHDAISRRYLPLIVAALQPIEVAASRNPQGLVDISRSE